MVEKKQVIHIHGGEAWQSYEDYFDFLREYEIADPNEEPAKKWRDSLVDDLGEDWKIIFPCMPSAWNAKYVEWKLWFEKYIPYMRDGVVFIGHSLGGVFLAKYLAEETLPCTVGSLHLVASPYGMHSKSKRAEFELPESLENIEKQVTNIHLYHSKDDPLVDFGDFEKYVEALPTAHAHTFEDRGHFLTPEFPELVENVLK